MKFICITISCLLVIGCGSTRKTTDSKNTNIVVSTLDDFLKSFEQAVLSHDAAKLLQCMDPEYKMRQHDQFLEGRTEQFLNEFLGGYDKENNWHNIKYTSITGIKLISKKEIENGSFEVKYQYYSDGLELTHSWLVTVTENGAPKKYGLWGAEG